MALQINISAKEFKNSFAIYDCTGTYSSSNQGGWGGSNPKIENVTSATFEIYAPESLVPVQVSVYPDFPTTDKELGYEITPSMLGMQHIESGTWKIVYVVNGKDNSGVNYTKKATLVIVFTNSAECCIDKMIKEVSPNAFDNKKQKLAVELWAELQAVKMMKDCFPTNAQKILKHINLQCACCGCV